MERSGLGVRGFCHEIARRRGGEEGHRDKGKVSCVVPVFRELVLAWAG